MNKIVVLLLFIISCSSSPKSSSPDVSSDEMHGEFAWKKLSLKEKISQMIMVRVRGDYYHGKHWYRERLKRWLSEDAIGGVITFGGSIHGSYYNIKQFQEWAKYPLLVAADYERGLGQWMGGATLFPTNMALAATGDSSLAYEQGKITGMEASAMGVHVTFSPVMDVNNNSENPIINFRSYSDDPQIVANFGTSFIKGAQDHGLIACVKHFPGHGNTSTDSHSSLPIIYGSRASLDSMELFPFQKALSANLEMVMVGHISLPSLDDSGNPASHSHTITTGLLRDEWGYDGIIITDGMEMGGLTESTWAGESTVRAVEAGSDILLLPLSVDQAIDALLDAVNSGRISEDRIDESVRRIWKMKRKVGILNGNYQIPFDQLEKVIGIPEHQSKANDIAHKSITVVKDDQDQLPLMPEKIDSLAHVIVSMDDGVRGYLKSFS